ncbi:MAG: DUF885 family protein [Bryobacterales bacterium]|nr:DUF885 family protein [Bryobacterales bacterium]
MRLLVFVYCLAALHGQVRRPEAAAYAAPDVAAIAGKSGDLRDVVERFSTDEASLQRFYTLPGSAATLGAMRGFYGSWRDALGKLNFESLGLEGKIDFVLLQNLVRYELRQLVEVKRRQDEMMHLLPFATMVTDLHEARVRVDPMDPAKVAARLDGMAKQLAKPVTECRAKASDCPEKRTVANRAARVTAEYRTVLKNWFEFYNEYDPLFTWWVAEPYKRLDAALGRYAEELREKRAGVAKGDRDTIVGDPIGREALLLELENEMIPYTPEELVEIAKQEFVWCDREMLKASRELGFGDDWKKALEHVKTLHVEPGKQTALIVEQAVEAIEFVEKHNLLTVPALARDVWRVQMMSPERQRVNPFFLGGESIIVSFPTSTMTHEQKMMSMRGNNIHFAHATVFHELIPGHNLQMFMGQRYRPYRRAFRTPFWMEGWALYWEFLLWDMGFHKTPENRIGALFWRMHRCARIIFSLSFHLEKMTAAEAVDFLVERVGHERENAAAEVRRSFETDYSPLYQVAYMMGGLQIRALHEELVKSGKMTNREFHDRILQGNSMPIAMVRASLMGQAPSRDYRPQWRFYGGLR